MSNVDDHMQHEIAALRARLAELEGRQHIATGGGDAILGDKNVRGDEVHGDKTVHHGVAVGEQATIHGPTVGTNLGQIIYNTTPSDEQREHLVRYMERVARKFGRLRLDGLSSLDDKGLQLPHVYVMLATTSKALLAQGSLTDVAPFFTFPPLIEADVVEQGWKRLKPEYDPALQLPPSAIINLTMSERMVDRPQAKSAHVQRKIVLERALLATEAVFQRQHLVLLGDPGGGKSTFLRHLAWALAERGLDRIGAATTLFGWPDLRRRLPVFMPLRKLAGRVATDGAHISTVSAALRDEMEREYDARRADEVLDRALARGAALLLFDGLDEVPLEAVAEQVTDRATVVRLVREFCELHGQARAVVTCRTRAFTDELRDLLGWPVETIAPFTLGQMRRYVQDWYAELVQRGSLDQEQASRQTRTLIDTLVTDAAQQRPRLLTMAGTPLLLTMMALVLYDKGSLPRDRSMLYENILEQLLGRWDQQKDGRSFAQVIGDDKVRTEVLRPLIDRLSFEAHAAVSSGDGRGRLEADQLMLELTKVLDAVRVDDPFEAAKRCLHYFSERSGLLLPEDDGKQYAFAHLTLQEHCAGRHLLLQPNARDLVLERRADDRWREPIFLGLGVLHKQYPMLAERIESILLRLIHHEELGQPKPVEHWYRDLIMSAELGADRDWDLLRPLIDVERVQDELRAGLVTLLQDRAQPLPVVERVRAGFLLGDLGDPRFPVTPEQWRFEIARAWAGDTRPGPSGALLYFCRVEPGTYIIGSADDDPAARDDEKPQHIITIAEPFLIGRYPFANEQWQAWVAAGGKPAHLADNSDWNRRNQPVVGVDWYQVSHCCAWLSEKLGADIRLPNENEWEAAARGGDARRFPWGATWSADRAATGEDQAARGQQVPAPLGCYPAGQAQCGALDMAGNVWEWTSDIWHSYPNAQAAFTNDKLRVLRGGGYAGNSANVRCSARFRSDPGNDRFYNGFRLVVAQRRAGPA